MERATQDDYITHRSIHEKVIMHQPSWSYASSITQPSSWRWSYQHGKSYTRWLHHTPINTQKDYHVSTFMIIRVKHNPTILALELSTWKELHKMITSHTDQYTGKKASTFIIMHQPSWSYASSITQPSSRWSYQHGKSYDQYTRPSCYITHRATQYTTNTQKDYHVPTFMIIRIKHNPTILALESSTWKELRKMVKSYTDQYTKRLPCINLHDHTHQA